MYSKSLVNIFVDTNTSFHALGGYLSVGQLRICPLPKGQKLRDGYALLLLDAVTTKELR